MTPGSVRCLACGHEYPSGPGRWWVVHECECPRCGYLGWTDAPPAEARRSLQPPLGQLVTRLLVLGSGR